MAENVYLLVRQAPCTPKGQIQFWVSGTKIVPFSSRPVGYKWALDRKNNKAIAFAQFVLWAKSQNLVYVFSSHQNTCLISDSIFPTLSDNLLYSRSHF